MRIAHVNARSLLHNFLNFRDAMCGGDYDLIGVSETWLGGAADESSDELR